VPKAAVNEHYYTLFRKREIWHAFQRLIVAAKASNALAHQFAAYPAFKF